MQQPGAIGAELLPRDRDDPPQHFLQFERGRERLEDARQKPVALLGIEMLRTRTAIEVKNHQSPHGAIVSIAVTIRKFEHARGRLFALRFVAHALPSVAGADRDDAERMAVEQVERLLLRGRHDGREAERSRNFSRSFCGRVRGHDQDLI